MKLAVALLLAAPAFAQTVTYTPKPLDVPYASDCRWNKGPFCTIPMQIHLIDERGELLTCYGVSLRDYQVDFTPYSDYMMRCELRPRHTLLEVEQFWEHANERRAEAARKGDEALAKFYRGRKP